MPWCRYAVVLKCAYFFFNKYMCSVLSTSPEKEYQFRGRTTFNKYMCRVLSTSPEKSINSQVVQLSINTCAVCCPHHLKIMAIQSLYNFQINTCVVCCPNKT